MDMWCGDCGHKWEADKINPALASCPSCSERGISIDLTTVYLTERGERGEYGVDYEYALDSTYLYDEETDEHKYEKVEFIPDGKTEGIGETVVGEKGSWVSRGIVRNKLREVD